MTSSEYKNTIEWTLKHSDESSDPEKVQRILRNLGTPFPQNDSNTTETIISLLSSGDYMDGLESMQQRSGKILCEQRLSRRSNIQQHSCNPSPG